MTKDFIAEILEQPQALPRCVSAYPSDHAGLAEVVSRYANGDYRQVVLTGMGSSLHACYPLWIKLNARLPIPAIRWDASELLHQAPGTIDDKTLLIAVSQSGETVEITRLLDAIQRPALTISISNGLDNTLARWADVTIDIDAGVEAAVSTKTYTSTLAALYLLRTHLLSENLASSSEAISQVAEDIAQFLQSWQSHLQQMDDFLGRCQNLAFIGRGASLTSVHTGAVITMESSKIVCLPLSGGQFRHGPLELVQPGFKAVIFAGPSGTRALNARLASEIASYGGRCLFITPESMLGQMEGILEIVIPASPSGLMPIAEIIPVQLLTMALARSGGFEPATFRHASKVTLTE